MTIKWIVRAVEDVPVEGLHTTYIGPFDTPAAERAAVDGFAYRSRAWVSA